MTSETIVAPASLARLTPCITSAVSPLWETAITTVFLSIESEKYSNSDAITTSLNLPAILENTYRPIRAAYLEEPQAVNTICFALKISIAASIIRFLSCIKAQRIACGCSIISFIMKKS